jgi:cytoskeleton protein RodZ
MADIGSTLREARMRARIDISEVEARTKIRAKYLRAMENEEWDLLPGPVYVKSFLRTYGDYLGLDSRLLVDDYRRRYERPSDHELPPVAPLSPRERDRSPRGPLLPPWAIIGAVLVVVVVALYLLGSGNKSKSPSPTGLRAGTHRHRRARHRTRPTRAKPSTVTVALKPTGAVYICLVDGTGKKLIPGRIFAAGQPVPPQTAPKMLLTLGNASVQMTVNGAAVAIAPSANSIGYLLTPSGAHTLPASQEPTCR